MTEACHFNRTCATWYAQIMTTFMVLTFCMCMIAFKDGQLEVYLPMITSTAAVWVPQPKAPKANVPASPPKT